MFRVTHHGQRGCGTGTVANVAYAQSNSPGGSTQGGSNVYDCFVSVEDR